jgi:hypothetical protein
VKSKREQRRKELQLAEDESDLGLMEHEMQDFATEEFINKNIRVRPSSGHTAVERDDKSDLQRGSLMGHGFEGMDEEDKFN